jgi:hypothetical protein
MNAHSVLPCCDNSASIFRMLLTDPDVDGKVGGLDAKICISVKRFYYRAPLAPIQSI